MTRACLDAADLPDALQEFVAGRAEGIPFLVEEVLAGLVGDGALTERGGRWHAADLSAPGVPATFANAVRRRLDGLSAESRQVIGAAAVLGRRFEWTLLGQVTGLADVAVVAALRDGVGLQLIVAERDSFRFRHALTHEAVLAGLLPPERTMLAGRALAAAEAAHPGLPGGWCTLAADLAGRAGDAARAGALLLEAGRRDLAVGALASAEHTLTRAAGLVEPTLRTSVDEALAEVFAMSGQVDRAIETGRMLLARLGPPSPRAAHLHLGIARAAIAGARWAEAAASIEVARDSAGADTAQVDACAAQVAAGQGRLEEADRLARAALQAAESGPGQRVQPEVACEALEVIGRVARQRDLEAAERAFARAADTAAAHGLQLWRLRALHELGTIDQLRTESVDRLEQARELAVAQGALALTATLDLQIAAGLNKQFRADEAMAAARRSADASRRFHLATLPMALIFQATAHAIRGEEGPMEDKIAEAVTLAPDDQDVLGCAWGHCRATFCLLAADLGAAHARMTTGAGLMLSSPATIAPPFLGLWPLLGALLGRDAADAAARVRAAHGTRHLVVATLLGYANAGPGRPPGPGRPGRGSVRRRRPADGAAGGLVPALRAPPGRGGGAGRRVGRAGRLAAGSRRVLRRARRRPGGGRLPGPAAPGRRAGAAAPGRRRGPAGAVARAGRDRTRGRRAQAGRPGPRQPRDRGADVPVATHRGEARGEPVRQDRPAPGPASWVFRRAKWVAAPFLIGCAHRCRGPRPRATMTDMITDQEKLAGGVTAVLERPGARLVYQVAGDGPAVVLIHGFGLDMRMWDPQVRPLAARFRVVRYDCRGFGASGPLDPAVPYSHAGNLVALLDHLDLGDAVLAGLSFGGRVALQVALAAPERVRGLALLDAVLDGVPWDPESARALERGRPAGPGGRGAGGPRGLAGPPAVRRRARAAGPGRRAGGHSSGLPRASTAGPGPAPPDQPAHRRARGHRRAGPRRRGTA